VLTLQELTLEVGRYPVNTTHGTAVLGSKGKQAAH